MAGNESWFVSVDGESREGPFTRGELERLAAEGRLKPDSLVWRDGMADWTPIARTELHSLVAARSGPPPLGAATPSPPPIRMTIPPGELSPAPRKTSGTVIGLIVGGVVLGSCLLCAVPVGILLPALGKARASARQISDSTMVRGVHQGMVLWAQNNNDRYPTPSQIDAANATLAAGQPKDLPRHIVSVMIFSGFFSPEICVSPAEVNPNIAVYAEYQYTMPGGAANPVNALWDPAYKAYATDTAYGTGGSAAGGLSFAIMPPLGGRVKAWSNTFDPRQAVVGNRGPAYDAVGSGVSQTWTLHPDSGSTGGGNTEVGTSSNTLLIHGRRTTWEGNIVYNDNHVNFETTPEPATALFPFAGFPRPLPDNLFVDENDITRAKDSTTGLSGAALGNTNNLLRGWDGGTFGSTGELIDIPSNFWFD